MDSSKIHASHCFPTLKDLGVVLALAFFFERQKRRTCFLNPFRGKFKTLIHKVHANFLDRYKTIE